jgi:hypothetical protein
MTGRSIDGSATARESCVARPILERRASATPGFHTLGVAHSLCEAPF